MSNFKFTYKNLAFNFKAVYDVPSWPSPGYYGSITPGGGTGVSGECVDTATGGKYCVDGCAPYCSSCQGTCGGACSNNCSGSCKGSCNVGCTGGAVDTIAARLYVHEYIEAANVQDIIELVKHELQRRGLESQGTYDNLTADATMTTALIFQHIRNNLQRIDHGRWEKINNVWYYIWENNQIVINEWIYYNGGYYYVDNDGHYYKNVWKTINGQNYHFNNDGIKDSGPDPTPRNIYTIFGDDTQSNIIYKTMAQYLVDYGLDSYHTNISTG